MALGAPVISGRVAGRKAAVEVICAKHHQKSTNPMARSRNSLVSENVRRRRSWLQKMRQCFPIGVAATVGLCGALAAQTPPGQRPPVNALENTSPATRATAALSEREVFLALKEAGFSDAEGLRKSSDGIWQGTALRNGAKVRVRVGVDGNITVY